MLKPKHGNWYIVGGARCFLRFKLGIFSDSNWGVLTQLMVHVIGANSVVTPYRGEFNGQNTKHTKET